jgi:anaerobic magnesium-protoporphyrin IX monomethyl ester cyclase
MVSSTIPVIALHVTLINPNLVAQRNDLLTTGIVYMPIGLAYFAASLGQQGIRYDVVDAFGECPQQGRVTGNYLIRGLKTTEVVDRIPSTTDAVVIYAISLTFYKSLADILVAVRRKFPNLPVIVMENTQAVTAFSLRRMCGELLSLGADYLLTGEAELRGVQLLRAIARAGDIGGIDGIGFLHKGVVQYREPETQIADLDALPMPAWDRFPLENYWRLKYAHGPFETNRYMPLLTSRGCPYPCRFCVIPETNSTKWRSRSPTNVVDEIEHYLRRFGVREFHIEDVNPTVRDDRIRAICREIITRDLDVIWKVSAGTKVESIKDEETLELMARSGCRYISISPESGSPRVMKMINKPFKLDHAIRLVRKMNQVGIRAQACFVLGFPGESGDDRAMTRQMVHDLTRVGVDEIALFIVTPVPGSQIHDQFSGYSDYSQLNFSPTWRADYAALNRFRFKLYASFLLWKILHHPLKTLRQPVNYLTRRFSTKMEMTPYRALCTFLLDRKVSRGGG